MCAIAAPGVAERCQAGGRRPASHSPDPDATYQALREVLHRPNERASEGQLDPVRSGTTRCSTVGQVLGRTKNTPVPLSARRAVALLPAIVEGLLRASSTRCVPERVCATRPIVPHWTWVRWSGLPKSRGELRNGSRPSSRHQEPSFLGPRSSPSRLSCPHHRRGRGATAWRWMPAHPDQAAAAPAVQLRGGRPDASMATQSTSRRKPAWAALQDRCSSVRSGVATPRLSSPMGPERRLRGATARCGYHHSARVADRVGQTAPYSTARFFLLVTTTFFPLFFLMPPRQGHRPGARPRHGPPAGDRSRPVESTISLLWSRRLVRGAGGGVVFPPLLALESRRWSWQRGVTRSHPER